MPINPLSCFPTIKSVFLLEFTTTVYWSLLDELICRNSMWYLRKVASLCEQLGPLSTCLCPKYITFFFQNLGNGREDENGRG